MMIEEVLVGESDEVVMDEVGGFSGGQHEQRPGKAANGCSKMDLNLI